VEDIGHISFLEERSETGVLKNSEAEPGWRRGQICKAERELVMHA
jgi:hypothetical protein